MVTTQPPGGRHPSEDELRELVVHGRDELAHMDDERLARLWRSIDEQVQHDDDRTDDGDAWPAASTSATASARGAPPSLSAPGPSTGPAVAPTPPVTGVEPAESHTDDPDGRVVPLRPGRAGRWRDLVPLAAAACLALVAGVGIGLSLSGDTTETEPALLATYDLAPFEGADLAATDAVLRDEDGTRTVELDLVGLPATDGFHEVWLLDPATGALTSLGPVRPDGRYVVPTGTDLAALTALDVSAEPLDGDPGHSGESLLRGEVVWTG